METQFIELLKNYKNKLSQYQNLKEKLFTKSDSLKKNLKTIQKEFQDEISVISDINPDIVFFSLPKIEDEDIGFCGTLEFEINHDQFRISRIGFRQQVVISFYKDEIDILGESYNSDKAYKQLNAKQFINVYKTVSYFLSNKDEIKRLIDDYLLYYLKDKNQIVSKDIAWISQLS